MPRGQHETTGLKPLIFRLGRRSRLIRRLIGIHYRWFVVDRFRIGVYVAVFRGNTETKEREILLVESWDGGLLLPGGAVDAKDKSLQAGALRELKEETGLDTSGVFPAPIASFKTEKYVAFVYKAGLTERDGKFTNEPLPSAECTAFEWLSYKDLFGKKGKRIKGGKKSSTWQLVHTCLTA